jgi:Phage capsid-like protein
MSDENQSRKVLGDVAARQLANTTKTVVQTPIITPRYLPRLLSWVPVEAGTYRVNRTKPGETTVAAVCGQKTDQELPSSYVDYVEKPREYTLSSIKTVLGVHSRITDLYSSPHDQLKEQLRLTVESLKERQEFELLNNSDYGLLKNVDASQRIPTRSGPPTPDDLDELIARVWKEPGFFLAHPRAIAAFGREATLRGVPPATVTLFGSPFITWRGIPLIPSDKIPLTGKAGSHKTSILLLRTGEAKQGVVGLFQPGLQGEQGPGLSVRFMGIDRTTIASYLVSLYCSAAILVDDAIASLENVDVDTYHEYIRAK